MQGKVTLFVEHSQVCASLFATSPCLCAFLILVFLPKSFVFPLSSTIFLAMKYVKKIFFILFLLVLFYGSKTFSKFADVRLLKSTRRGAQVRPNRRHLAIPTPKKQ